VAVETDDYCRAIESYLCRKNDGHLIRIVGPAFERVCAWADQGVPLKAAYRGIDRYFERYHAKGQRRRPVRVEFCEADVMDVFDEWRRAVRVTVARETADTYGTATAGEEAHHRAHMSLKNHLERTLGRLRGAQAEGALVPVVEDAIRLVEGFAVAPPSRGEARRRILEELRACDGHLIAAAHAQCDGPAREALVAEADEELAPFRARMPAEAYEQSRQACVARLIRERLRLPVLTYE
jgi:hypothetical protein